MAKVRVECPPPHFMQYKANNLLLTNTKFRKYYAQQVV